MKIRNLAILEDVCIEAGPGLNVLTGETGAGKSILIDAIGLVLGERGGVELIRTGCDRLIVEAQFDGPQTGLRELAGHAGLEIPDGEPIVVSREVTAGGRSRALVNGRLVALATLRELGEILADLHGQHQHQSLLKPDEQRDALDRFAGLADARAELAGLHGQLRELGRQLEELSGRDRERAQREDALRHQISDIDAVAPRPGEDVGLAREEALLRHAEEIATLAGRGFSLISEDDESALARLGGAEECSARLAAIDPTARDIVSALREARSSTSEAARALSRYLEREELDPGRLDQVATRLASLERLRRRYGDTLKDVLEHRERAAAELTALGEVESRRGEIAARLDAMLKRYSDTAGRISGARQRAARLLERAVQDELKGLAMGGTRVEVAVDPAPEGEPASHGWDTVRFLIAPNTGEELRPLSRIASGGELSRLMLAVRNAARDGLADARILIFDEIDSGVGGQVAEAIGQRLAALAKRQQVFCVTHLPQIASFADRHFQVTKSVKDRRTRAHVELLEGDGRVDELARMLGGSPAPTARRHAEALLALPGRSSNARAASRAAPGGTAGDASRGRR